jgi:hypothetical protein
MKYVVNSAEGFLPKHEEALDIPNNWVRELNPWTGECECEWEEPLALTHFQVFMFLASKYKNFLM